MNAAPPPERVDHWRAQALELLAVRTPVDKVLTHLDEVGCPPDLARAIVARARAPAYSRLGRKTLHMLVTGLALIAYSAFRLSSIGAVAGPGVSPFRPICYLALGIGLVMYAVLQWWFDRIDARSTRFRAARIRRPFRIPR